MDGNEDYKEMNFLFLHFLDHYKTITKLPIAVYFLKEACNISEISNSFYVEVKFPCEKQVLKDSTGAVRLLFSSFDSSFPF